LRYCPRHCAKQNYAAGEKSWTFFGKNPVFRCIKAVFGYNR
jgi:hypothetical protein